MNSIVQQNSDLATDVGETTEVSWTPPEQMTFEQYERIGRTFQQINRSLAWWVGDWLAHGERKFGEMYAQAIEVTDKSAETLMKYKAVAQRVGKDVRQPTLSWSHHFYVAYLDPDQVGGLLAMAANLGLSSRELMQVAKLEWNQREDLMIAASEGIEHDAFMRLVNQFRLGESALPKVDDDDGDDDEDDMPFTDLADNLEDEDADEPSEPPVHGLDYDTVMDYWENVASPLKFCGQSEAIWEGMSVRAGQDSEGRFILIWERVP